MEKYKRIKEDMSATVSVSSDDSKSDEQILRTAIASELSAINLYQQLIHNTNNEVVKNILMSIIDEEKVHIGEFTSALNVFIDPTAVELHNKGTREVYDILDSLEGKKDI